MAVSVKLNKQLPVNEQSAIAPVNRQISVVTRSAILGSSSRDLFSSIFDMSRDQSAACLKIMAKEDFNVRDLIKYGLIAQGYAMDPILYDSAKKTPALLWLEAVKSIYWDVDVKQVLLSGLRLLSQLSNPPQWPSLENYQVPKPALSGDSIILSPMSYLWAQLINAQHLRYTTEDLMRYEAESKFYIEGSDGSGSATLANELEVQKTLFSRDMQPTILQRTVRHHPYIDLVPWPSLRDGLIKASLADPPIIDEDDFCFDMVHGGLRCWGNMLGSMHGRGEGVPWDARSWEALPWWLEKWKSILGGEDSEIYRISAWWRAIRGADVSQTQV